MSSGVSLNKEPGFLDRPTKDLLDVGFGSRSLRGGRSSRTETVLPLLRPRELGVDGSSGGPWRLCLGPSRRSGGWNLRSREKGLDGHLSKLGGEIPSDRRLSLRPDGKRTRLGGVFCHGSLGGMGRKNDELLHRGYDGSVKGLESPPFHESFCTGGLACHQGPRRGRNGPFPSPTSQREYSVDRLLLDL